MKFTRIHFQWTEKPAGQFRTGVSLHSHTLHSRESLDFIYHAARHSGLLRWMLRRGEAQYRRFYGSSLDLRRGWWTPPLAPRDAYALEFGQISGMGMAPIVSLTDHDDIEAPMSLQAIDASRQIPISVEWTVPFRNTFFHLGVHNLPAEKARATMSRLAAFTAHPGSGLRDVLADLHADPATLVVFNHPLWDESGVGADAHRSAVLAMLSDYGAYLHALEVNGLRPWHENRAVLRLAQEWGKPVVSGGDRHVVEPNVVLNLTNAQDFPEFVDEIRGSGWSDVLVTSQYRQSHATRIFHNMLDVFRTYENHGHGWKEWADRVFYTFEDGTVASLSQIWGERAPRFVGVFAGLMRLAGAAPVRHALRSGLLGTEEVLL